MKQRITILVALFFLLLAGIVALSKHRKSTGSTEKPSAATNGKAPANSPKDSEKSLRARRETIAPNRNEKMATQMKANGTGRDFMVSLWVKSAADAFAKTSQNLATDLGLSEEQAADVDALFAVRKEQLAGMLASLTSDEADDPHETLRRITALMRNKGLRDGLAGILTGEQLAAFDATEANRRDEAIEAKTRSDMAAVNTALTLTDSEKQSVLAALSARAAGKVEEEADARALMSLSYGEMAAVIDLSNLRGLAAQLNPDLDDVPDFAYGSTVYFRWKEKERAARIESELSPLRHILDESQLARYREHLELQMPK